MDMAHILWHMKLQMHWCRERLADHSMQGDAVPDRLYSAIAIHRV